MFPFREIFRDGSYVELFWNFFDRLLEYCSCLGSVLPTVVQISTFSFFGDSENGGRMGEGRGETKNSRFFFFFFLLP